MSKIIITLPKPKVDNEEKELQIKKIIGEDYERKDGLISKCLIFTHLNQPVSITELKDLLQGYYQLEVDRVAVFRATDRLYKLGVLHRVTSGDVLTMSESEKEKIHKKIEEKYKKWLSKIQPQFRRRYTDINYIWVSNGEGEKYLEWACKLNGFKFEKR